MSNTLNKSFLAPRADALSSVQLTFLVLNYPFLVLVNNYKSDFLTLSTLRNLINFNNGFAYHPNKNIKTRAFKGFNTVLPPSVLNGLVVFAFFRDHSDVKQFLNSVETLSSLSSIGYYSLMVYGHLVKRSFLSDMNDSTGTLAISKTSYVCNKIFIDNSYLIFTNSLNKIYLILNAYVKSTN